MIETQHAFKILLIEDSPEYQFIVRETLGIAFDLTCVASGAAAKTQFEKNHFDLILLDVGLPDTDGYKLCSEFRKSDKTNTPIIFITGKSSLSDKVFGFTMGADDYIVKPFEPIELKVRVESKLRNKMIAESSKNVVNIGDIMLSIPYQRATIQTDSVYKDLNLNPLEFKLLYYFANREEMVLTRGQLLKEVWGNDVTILERTIDKHISGLRQKLTSTTHTIKTVSGVGYKLQKL